MSDRLNKFLARAGVASRRKCDQLIREGRIWVNGELTTNPAFQVRKEDQVFYNGKRIVIEENLTYLQFYKPRDCLTTLKDPRARRTIKDYFSGFPYRIFPAGRLDWESEGLLILTNDGNLTYFLTHPRFEVEKKYLAYVSGAIDQAQIDSLQQGIVWKDTSYHIRRGKILQRKGDISVVELVLTEGKKHEVRIMLDYLGYPVLRLIRSQMGPIKLDPGLLPGEWRFLTPEELTRLQQMMKNKEKGEMAGRIEKDDR